MELVVIEGPGKRETLKKYLKGKYEVFATKGHIRDLPANVLAVDVNNNFEPTYVNSKDKLNIIKELKDLYKKADKIYLATDPDREGEAISWHIANVLGIPKDSACRIEFHEISEKAVNEAIKNPRIINQNLVDAQQARRVLDRLVGYKVSPIVSKKIKPKLSAGRVQSVALKIIVDREREIENFVPKEYYVITCENTVLNDKTKFNTTLYSYKDKKIKVENKEEADKIVEILKANDHIVSSIKKSKTKVKPMAPFTTSTMQQEALNKLGMNIKKTSQIAQNLYEGVEIAGEGKTALITYIRTDSTRISNDAYLMAKDYILNTYGKNYVPSKQNVFTSKNNNIQDAHEAIRPISLKYKPEDLVNKISTDHYKLYKLIYDRFVASQMVEAEYNNVTVNVKSGDYGLRAVGRTLAFNGFSIVYKPDTEEKETVEKIPVLNENDKLNVLSVKNEQKFTKPPVRFTEATLVKEMEENGIGRPATYAQIILVLYNRTYIVKEGKSLVPTELGKKVSDFLNEYFKDIINIKFTADMENSLDKIAEDGKPWKDVIAKFYKFFEKILLVVDKTAKKQPAVLTDKICDKCGSPMVLRNSKYGDFYGCSNYPNCKNIVQIEKTIKKIPISKEEENMICPVCGKPVIKKLTKKGKYFYGCSDYPNCKFASWNVPTDKKCPKCNSLLEKKLKKDGYDLVCSNEKCDFKEENNVAR